MLTEQQYNIRYTLCSEAEFLDVIGTKVLRVFLLAIHISPLLTDFTPLLPPPPPPPLSKSGFELVCYVNNVYENIKSENSQDYAQKPQQKLYVHEFGFC
jgi:hypothetical protein